jgi:hypothetical protein
VRIAGTTIGFEGGAIPMTVAIAGYTSDLVSANARTGTYAMRIDGISEGRYIDLGANLTELYARIAFRPSKVGGPNYVHAIVTFRNSDGEPMLMVGYPPDTLTLTAYRKDTNYTTLATGADLTLNTWALLEVHINGLANADGIMQVKVNGALVIDFTGDTLGTESPASIRQVVLGGATTGSPYHYAAQGLYDDLAVNDTTGNRNNTWVGRGGIYPMLVTAAGPVTGLTPSAGDNYECVNEVPPDDADYVSSDVVDATDLYELSDLTAEGNVDVVTAWPRAALAAAGEGNIASVIRLDGVDYVGDDSGLDTTYVYKPQQWEVNPATGNPWTIEELNAATTFAGPRVR